MVGFLLVVDSHVFAGSRRKRVAKGKEKKLGWCSVCCVVVVVVVV